MKYQGSRSNDSMPPPLSSHSLPPPCNKQIMYCVRHPKLQFTTLLAFLKKKISGLFCDYVVFIPYFAHLDNRAKPTEDEKQYVLHCSIVSVIVNLN